MINFLENFIGQNITAGKFSMAVDAITALAIVWALIIFVGFFWLKIKLWKRCDFWMLFISLAALVAVKAFFLKNIGNYILDRFPIYALLSPKVISYWAMGVAVALFLLLAGAYNYLFKINRKLFLVAIIIFSVLFSWSVAAIRGGEAVYEPFTRAGLDYYGDINKIVNPAEFLKNYNQLAGGFSLHGKTHPPGYILTLYFLDKLFVGNLLSIAVGVIFLGALSLVPVYFIAKKIWDEKTARFSTIFFSFIPAYVIFGAVSMEVIFLTITSFLLLAIVSADKHRGWALSGVIYSVALFFNFLALLYLPTIALLAYLKERKLVPAFKKIFLFVGSSAVVFLLLEVIFGFDIIKTFIVSRAANNNLVKSNFESFSLYFIYLGINISAFLVYLGWPVIFGYFKNLKDSASNFFSSPNILLLPGLVFFILLLAAGIFQGEVERIWLFLLPFLVLPAAHSFARENDPRAALMPQFLAIISIQTLFYTYW